MPDSSAATSAARLLSLNKQAIAILRLGIPLDLGLPGDPAEHLHKINDRLIADVGRQLSPDELLQRHSFPERYHAIARVLLASDDPAPIFESIAMPEIDRQAAANPLRQAIVEPVVVAFLVYFGMIFLCWFTVPHIEYQYTQQGQEPTGVTRLMVELRETMPYWIVGFPIVAVACWLVWRRLAKGVLMKWIPGSGAYTRWLAAESQTRRLAALVGSGLDQESALAIANASVSPHVQVRPIAETIVRSGDPRSRSRALGRLAKFYHFLADDRRRTYFSKLPALIGLFVAGFVVLGYALATFLPWIEILRNLSGSEVGY